MPKIRLFEMALLTSRQREILELALERKSSYRIARELNKDPGLVSRTLEVAKKKLEDAEKTLAEMKALGWPEKLERPDRQPENMMKEKA
jgi:DNA-binding CsgD family transcriptional regulator